MSENPWKSRWTKDQLKSMVLEQFDFFGNWTLVLFGVSFLKWNLQGACLTL